MAADRTAPPTRSRSSGGSVSFNSISVNAVERAHHLILFSRAPGYRREHLASLHHDEPALFEHWTHDASLIPMEFYPHWRHRFRAAKAKMEANPRWQDRIGPEGEKVIAQLRRRRRRRR